MSVAGLQRPCVIRIRSAVHRFLCGWTYFCRSTSKALSSGLSQQWCRFSFREEGGVPFIPVEAKLFLYQNDWGRFTDLQIGFFQLAPSRRLLCSLCHIYPVVLLMPLTTGFRVAKTSFQKLEKLQGDTANALVACIIFNPCRPCVMPICHWQGGLHTHFSVPCEAVF